MKLASTLRNNTVRIPFTYHFNLHKTSTISCHKNARVQFSLRRSYPLYPGNNIELENWTFIHLILESEFYWRTVLTSKIYLQMPTDPKPLTSKQVVYLHTKTNQRKTSISPSHDGVDDIDCSDNISSISNSEEKTPKSLINAVGVLSCCIWVGLGFKDGVGKAYKFFAGCLLE
ncbi:Myrosinase 4 [Olea europaea subsp. europaea]|uniref:Myrosinase 4 n=1 Tax=Olea europaea subsp. europaea TaxID=158383 RepID=A0A8S0TG94_OLEEU|nr:Myrosinase 4 [Olea europaea subsp. europaea]